MKKLFLIISLLSTLFISCGKDDDKATLELSEKASILNVENTAVQKSITVFTNQKTWSATENAEWINTKQNSDKLDIEISANETESERQADITFKAGNATKKITIKQAAGTVEKPTLSISPEGTIEVAAKGDDKYITIKTNQKSWDCSKDVDWITLSKEENTLIIKVSENKTTTLREADVTITAGTLNTKVNIKQEGINASIELDPSSIEIGNAGGEKTVNVTSTLAWNAEYDKSIDWFTIETSQTALKINIKANKSENERKATITIKDDAGTTATLTITQSAIIQPDYDKIPTGNTNFGIGKQELIDWEIERGATFNESESTALNLTFYFEENPASLLKRSYTLLGATGGISACTETYRDIAKFFTKNGDSYNISADFDQRATNQKYQYAGLTSGKHTYMNTSNGIMLIVRIATYKGNDAVCIDYLKL